MKPLLCAILLGLFLTFAQGGQQLPITTTSVTASGSVAAGARHIEFILSTDFSGTINGATLSGATVAVYGPGTAPEGYVFNALTYTVSAGSLVITTW